MDLLLDTHTFLWWDRGELARSVVKRIQAAGDVYVSAASNTPMQCELFLDTIAIRSTGSWSRKRWPRSSRSYRRIR